MKKIGDIMSVDILIENDIDGKLFFNVNQNRFIRSKIDRTEGIIKAIRETKSENESFIEYLISIRCQHHKIGIYGDTFCTIDSELWIRK